MPIDRKEALVRARDLDLPCECIGECACIELIADAIEKAVRDTAQFAICRALENADELRASSNWVGQAALMKLVFEIRIVFGEAMSQLGIESVPDPTESRR